MSLYYPKRQFFTHFILKAFYVIYFLTIVRYIYTFCNKFWFINLFNSALHVSGDKFSHPQEHFLTVYTAFGKMH